MAPEWLWRALLNISPEPDFKLWGDSRVCYYFRMSVQDALATLRRYESALRARGVTRAAVFGSLTRG